MDEEKPRNMTEKLAIQPDRALGESLLGAAQEQFKKKRSEEVLAQVTELMNALENARNWEARNRECAEIIERKIKAVELGLFHFENRRIVFEDKDLNRPYPHNMGFGQ